MSERDGWGRIGDGGSRDTQNNTHDTEDTNTNVVILIPSFVRKKN